MLVQVRQPHYNWSRRCQFCNILLLTGERNGEFCCGQRGKYAHIVAELPPLPAQFIWLANKLNISFLSRKLNLLFSFAAMETTEKFPILSGPLGFVAIQG
ncbi:hypothetical protein M422DRAFT_182044 [Sphaerobolus stellatus SS14]|uniref:Unplaced genomic scaffold SPHSTscaffold_124, whole genome shotgun sequence n=1 Tax=Sphaerobolus stellatus (strain SS14) TaxID=990650 RepID=A0A0C9VB20_SPHS4|nr:hypothetical protein M422DRAFT_182044 [Sphaerobolus stellatus SS14]